jgi:hypothetical protein
MNHILISHSLQNVSLEKQTQRLKKEINDLKSEKKTLKKDLEFYKSIFKTHSNSVVFNLTIKSKNGEKVWIDHIRCSRNELLDLDMDDEILEWLKPIKCSR